MSQDRRYFNDYTKVEPDTNSEKNLNDPFNVLNLNNIIPQEINNSIDDINNVDISINNLDAESNQQEIKIFTPQNNDMFEQIEEINFEQKSNLYSLLNNDRLEENEINEISQKSQIIIFKEHQNEVNENYNDFKEGIKFINNANQSQNIDIKIENIDMKNEILLNEIDINDSFIAEQFCLEELISDDSIKKLNFYSIEKEEKDENKNKMNISHDENDYEKTKKMLKAFIEKKEAELKFEKFNNKGLENIKKPNFESKEKLNENLEKVKASEISEKIESNKNGESKISDSKIEELKYIETNKNKFYIEKKNKSFIKSDSFNEAKVIQDKSNSSTKDSLSPINTSNTSFKSQACFFSDISNEENKNKIFNITKIFKDESKLNKSYMFECNFAINQESEISQKSNNSLISGSRINNMENIKNKLSTNNSEHIQDKTKKSGEDLLKNKRDKVKNFIKKNYTMRYLSDFEKNIYREFTKYLLVNKKNYNNISSLDDKFWKIISEKNILKKNLELKKKKIKYYSHELMEDIFSKDAIPTIYESFLKDNDFHENYMTLKTVKTKGTNEEENKKKYKNEKGYELYRKNFHKIYSYKYKEKDLDLK